MIAYELLFLVSGIYVSVPASKYTVAVILPYFQVIIESVEKSVCYAEWKAV